MGVAAAAALHDAQQLQLKSRVALGHHSPGRHLAAEVPSFASHACKFSAQRAACLLLVGRWRQLDCEIKPPDARARNANQMRQSDAGRGRMLTVCNGRSRGAMQLSQNSGLTVEREAGAQPTTPAERQCAATDLCR